VWRLQEIDMGDQDLPAILGGSPLARGALPPWPPKSKQFEAALADAVQRTSWWRPGGIYVDRFEQRFSDYHAGRPTLAVTNGTHALELALRTLGVGPHDQVIVPALTFASCAMAVRMVGAEPVPVDVDPETWCLDAAATKAAITARTRGVMVVHFGGHMADMVALEATARAAGCWILEDCAQAIGARRQGRLAGVTGRMATFSFQASKTLTSGEGGAVLFERRDDHAVARVIGHCGHAPEDTAFLHERLGSNYRLNEFAGALLCAQLDTYDDSLALRDHNGLHLEKRMHGLPGVTVQARAASVERHGRWCVAFTCDADKLGGLDRATVVKGLVAEGFIAFRAYPLIQDGPWFKKAGLAADRPCPNARRVSDTGVCVMGNLLVGSEASAMLLPAALERIVRHADRVRDHCAVLATA
jgi:3-amino-5-hydroxybenzoate synthase